MIAFDTTKTCSYFAIGTRKYILHNRINFILYTRLTRFCLPVRNETLLFFSDPWAFDLFVVRFRPSSFEGAFQTNFVNFYYFQVIRVEFAKMRRFRVSLFRRLILSCLFSHVIEHKMKTFSVFHYTFGICALANYIGWLSTKKIIVNAELHSNLAYRSYIHSSFWNRHGITYDIISESQIIYVKTSISLSRRTIRPFMGLYFDAQCLYVNFDLINKLRMYNSFLTVCGRLVLYLLHSRILKW